MANIKQYLLENVFGFQTDRKAELSKTKQKTFTEPSFNDDAEEIVSDYALGGESFNYGIGFGVDFSSEKELINEYRKLALNAEIDMAIDEIVNEIVNIEDKEAVTINLDEIDLSDEIKDKIRDEFKNILKLLKFKNHGNELIKQWYTDGRLFHHIIVNNNSKKEGIKELRLIDPREIKKVKEIKRGVDPKTGVEVIESIDTYFTYKADETLKASVGRAITDTMIKVPSHSISYVNSGLYDEDVNNKKMIISYLHKALKPFNQLDMLESASVIYRLSRAPERRVFYIDVGNLPKTKAEAYMSNIITRYKNKSSYDSKTGKMKNSADQMSMLEDIWLPRSEGSKGTEIDTLPSGQNLGEITDILYFKKKLNASLHLPISRLESESQFNVGRPSEITRDEVKLAKFVEKLRGKFSNLFFKLLHTQLTLKNIITNADWSNFKDDITFDYSSDLYFKELKETEILKERLEILQSIDEYTGKYFSIDYVKRNILRQTDDIVKEEETKMKKEKDDGSEPSEEEVE